MRTLLLLGLLALTIGLLWIGLGVGMVEWPQTSFMIEGHGYGAAALAAAGQLAEPLGLSIADVAAMTGESAWTVKQKLRLGIYKAKKSGRRTIIIYQSVKEGWESLPEAKFLPPTRRGG
jgi:hypothetical protein